MASGHRPRRSIWFAVTVAVLAVGLVRFGFPGEMRAWWYRNYCEVRVVGDSDGFDYPVGAPNARGYYRAQRFGGDRQHLGEDWNGIGGGNSDYGDPVYTVADGVVTFSKDVGMGWGKVVRVIHPVWKGDPVEAVYAHLAEMKVRKGDTVKRGQVLGTMGDADGAYPAHLHFEIRAKISLPLGGGYGDPKRDFLDPTEFIDKHRRRS